MVLTLSELMLRSGVSESTLWFLKKYGLDFEDDGFDIDKNHRKAFNDLRNKRLSPYVLAYAWRCQIEGAGDNFCRFDNLETIAKIKGLSIRDGFADIRSKQIIAELLPTAKYWIDRTAERTRHTDAFERLALWCKEILKAAPPVEVDHAYLAVRLLCSLTSDEMREYPTVVQRALNKIRHHGFLDGWWRIIPDEAGKNTVRYARPKYDL